nr:glycosyltransferase [Motilibacter aurantiacus]
MTPTLAAVLIVRDEEHTLARCLGSLQPLARAGLLTAVHVHDTGSSDATVRIAGELGAIVTTGPWTEDFAAARNAALAGVAADWVLSLDADECVEADPDALAGLLAGSTADGLTVEIENVHDDGTHTHRHERLLRVGAVCWTGRVHEHLTPVRGGGLRLASAPAGVLRLTHDGYATPQVRRRKSERNAALAQAELDRLAASSGPEPELVAKTLLDLGRSCIEAGRAQDAVDAFEAVRALFPGTRRALEATDSLARVLLAAGLDDVVLVLVGQLRDGGAPRAYCDWLEAQARAQLGDVRTALALIEGVDELVDTGGRRFTGTGLAELKHLLRQLVPAAG